MPYLGQLFLDQIYDATLRPFKEAMQARGWKSKSVNLALRMVRRILNLAARSISDILWHARAGMTPHYSVAQVREIHAALELIARERHGWNRTLASIAHEAVGTCVPTQRKSG
jgi:hypothetical protein